MALISYKHEERIEILTFNDCNNNLNVTLKLSQFSNYKIWATNPVIILVWNKIF